MKIAHVSITALPASVGGLEIVVDSLIRHQRRLGHDVSLITRWKQARAATSASLGYPVHALPPNPKISSEPFRDVGPRIPAEIAFAWHHLRNRFDVVHAHFLYPTAWLVHRPLKRLQVPMIATAHGADINVDHSSGYGYRQHEVHERRLRDLCRDLKATSAISDSAYRALQDLGIDNQKIHRIANGIELDRFTKKKAIADQIRKKLDIPAASKMLLSVGKNQPSKGYGIIPEVLGRLRELDHNVIWVIVGSGVKNLEGLFSRAGLLEAVRLCDSSDFHPSNQFPPDDLIGMYQAANAFVFPSLSEGAPLVAMEAMAAGLPIIGNNVRGIADTIEHEKTGLLVEPSNPAALAHAISRMLSDTSMRERCIRAASTKVAQHDWAKIAAQYLDVYRALIERNSA